ncbi:DUF1656 domain-containing protein [Segnochrobactrum spirostomi]|uniref:DUF1656 domain-containing protein n=1 Tax=Segnochrobactrum spirostomi TaxID=2608987 RepID=A0A6A7Y6S5_9HYPH|nr:DUF1656 domain-containing protein [Segnochrobactrum spirostomi]MQT15030.1 DUF1656 domain-containing protein [Segnochrobactrum spirostomi]
MFTEVDILGVLISPFVVMMFAAWLIVTPIAIVLARYSVFGTLWQERIFHLCLYTIILSIIVIYIGEHHECLWSCR